MSTTYKAGVDGLPSAAKAPSIFRKMTRSTGTIKVWRDGSPAPYVLAFAPAAALRVGPGTR